MIIFQRKFDRSIDYLKEKNPDEVKPLSDELLGQKLEKNRCPRDGNQRNDYDSSCGADRAGRSVSAGLLVCRSLTNHFHAPSSPVRPAKGFRIMCGKMRFNL